ncbi:hypothetical protein TIFTF001_006408 [Ficus carica]|uniref:Calmodulin-binding family protein n=1 Tax=Ficus carica TaxID=3494 RepID=A0AA87ZR56_FICCA|nr:hypothetical protein TIFTF001_006408 [Ficus carica]
MVTVRSVDFKSRKRERFENIDLNEGDNSDDQLDQIIIEEPTRSLTRRRLAARSLTVETTLSFDDVPECESIKEVVAGNVEWFSPRPASELNAAATKLQKVYKSYRTRRNLAADCAVVIEELWWKALDFAALRRSSVSFFDSDKSETAVSRWARARTRAAKIDPRHRYGYNLHKYYQVWFDSETFQPFFYWLDAGDGKEINLEKYPRTDLQHQCITYLGPVEREAYEVIVVKGKLLYKQSKVPVETAEGTKWIFVLSTSRRLYVAEKKKGVFQHSSFLAGGATIAAGRLIAHNGILEAIWPYSGHYCPTEENFMDFISFLEEHHVDLTNVKKCPMDDDIPPSNKKPSSEMPSTAEATNNENGCVSDSTEQNETSKVETPKLQAGKCWASSSKWTTEAGPRISCVREYPTQVQFEALEQWLFGKSVETVFLELKLNFLCLTKPFSFNYPWERYTVTPAVLTVHRASSAFSPPSCLPPARISRLNSGAHVLVSVGLSALLPSHRASIACRRSGMCLSFLSPHCV